MRVFFRTNEDQKEYVEKKLRSTFPHFKSGGYFFKKYLERYITADSVVLDAGCGNGGMISLYIEHLTNPAEVFKEICGILKPEGVFIFITPNTLSPIMGLSKLMPHGAHKLLRKKLLRKTEEAHRTFYRANTLKKLLKFGNSAGFKHLEIRRAGNPEYLGFIKPLVPLSLFLEKFIDNHFLGMFKMYLIGSFRK